MGTSAAEWLDPFQPDPSPGVHTGRLRVYRFHLAAGKTWRFAVDAFAGDPDLYVWNAAGALVGYSNALDLAAETVTVLAAESGVFQVEVHGYRDSRYTLSGQATAERAVTSARNAGKALPHTPVVPLTSTPAVQQVLPSAPEGLIQNLFLPVTLR